MKVTLCSIVLNEAEYVGRNLAQHYDLCDQWIIVEGADRRYPAASCTEDGLSTDETASIIRDFPDPQKKIQFIQHGWAADKCELRNKYAERVETNIVIVVDADEFLSRASFANVVERLADFNGPGCLRIPHVHLWPDMQSIVTGSYADVPHNRCYRWAEGARYLNNHNHPCFTNGRPMHEPRLKRIERALEFGPLGATHPEPFWLHLGFCKSDRNIGDKNAYYLARGEAVTRSETSAFRAALLRGELPKGCCEHRWMGPMPEVFLDKPAKPKGRAAA